MVHLSLLSVYNFIRRGLVRRLAEKKPPSPSPSPAKVDLSPDLSPSSDLSTTSLIIILVKWLASKTGVLHQLSDWKDGLWNELYCVECWQFAGQIRNGESSDGPLIGRYCGYALPAPIQSTGNALWMKFKTDMSVRRPGFHLQYTAANTGGGGPVDGGSGTSTSGLYLRFFVLILLLIFLLIPQSQYYHHTVAITP